MIYCKALLQTLQEVCVCVEGGADIIFVTANALTNKTISH